MELREYWLIARRWWWLLVVCTLFGGGASFLISSQMILSHYLVRWEVENFYRVAKQSLGWGGTTRCGICSPWNVTCH